MKDNSLLKLGGLCAILVGVSGALASLVYLLLPAEQRLGVPAATILPSIAQGAPWLNAEFLLLTLVGIFGLGAVAALTRMVSGQSEGWANWTSMLALVGFAVQGVSNFLTFTRLPGIATAFVNGDASTKAALVPVWRSSFDLDGLWGFGAVGVWVLVVSFLALRGKVFPAPANYLGIVAGIFYLVYVVGFVLKQPDLFLLASVVGTLAATIWYVWVGWLTRRAA